MDFLTSMYSQDLKDAALSPKAFDRENAEYIANRHGRDPKGVRAEIKELRKAMEK